MASSQIKAPFLLTNLIKNTYFKRFSSSTAQKLLYTEYGEPHEVVKLVPAELEDPQPNEVVVQLIAAPINPADINIIQGKYPSKPTLPAVPGNEGVGKIVQVGAEACEEFSEGDRVIPLSSNLGTWQTHLVLPKESVLKIPKKVQNVQAATLTVNPCTAFRMLRDFADLKPGDTVIQNGANSACGQNVIQICKAWGLRSVNIVRDRPNLQELKQYLIKLGANYVLTEDELRKTDLFKSGLLSKPKLALNCVGGKNALECLRHLENGSPMVTYGGMSREPLNIPTSALIFKDLQFRGFWMTRWTKENFNSVDRFEMLSELISMMTSNELQAPAHEMIKFKDYKEALKNALNLKGMVGKKYILDFE